jgi:hypothetical protein
LDDDGIVGPLTHYALSHYPNEKAKDDKPEPSDTPAEEKEEEKEEEKKGWWGRIFGD